MNELGKCWKNCMSMWRWIAKVYQEGESVTNLKHAWLRRHNVESGTLYNSCFFCDFTQITDGAEHTASCTRCPAYLVDSSFACASSAYSWDGHPKEFYNKLRSLYKLYKKG